MLLLLGGFVAAGVVGEIFLRMLNHHGAPRSTIGNIHRVDDEALDWR